jgi:LPXTG-motif cell wall-anchored protein
MSMIIILSIAVGVEALLILLLLLLLKRRKKKYKEHMNKVFRSWNTSRRQLNGMEDLFSER